jgi:VCBS repeat-containing protein
VKHAGTTFGVIVSNGLGGNDLVINLNANATVARVQDLLRALQYENTNTIEPNTSSRTVRVTVNDGVSTSSPADVTVNVTAQNDAPVAVTDTYSAQEDTQLVIAAPGVLGNDSDLEGDPLTAVLNTDAGHGTLALNANGSFTYMPDSGYTGGDSFTYHANDGIDDSNVVTVTIQVEAVEDVLYIYLPLVIR